MPGLIGLVPRRRDEGLADAFDRMLTPMRRSPRFSVETAVDPRSRWAIGRVHLGALQAAPQLTERGPVHVLFHGDLHNEQELRQRLDPSGQSIPDGTSALVAALYARHGRGAAAMLRGAYSAAVLDEERGQVLLVNDLLGSYPLYWHHTGGRLAFASELRAIMRAPDAPAALDPRAASDYIQFGFVFGTRTLAASASLLPSASTLQYDMESGAVDVQRFRRIADLFAPADAGDRGPRIEHLRETFGEAVGRAQQGGQSVGLSLSGGLDTRAILSAFNGTAEGLRTYTLGVKGCADEVIADDLSRKAGTAHRFFELDDRYLSEFLPQLTRMVSLTDGMYLSHGLTEMLALRFLEEPGFSVLLRGHCGEMAKASLAWPLHTDPQVHAMRNRDELIPHLLRRISHVGDHALLAEVFTGDWFEQMNGGPKRSLEESLDGLTLAPPDLCSYLYLEEQHRRYTIPSLELFRNIVDVRMPFADELFLTELLSMPAAWRDGTDIHRALISPALRRVRNSNTGAAADAGPLAEKIFDKLNTLLRRLNVHGYRHYHHFDAWMKSQLIASVESVLLDSTTLGRGMLREAALRRLIGETKAGTADHGYLFQALLIIELWQREQFT